MKQMIELNEGEFVNRSLILAVRKKRRDSEKKVSLHDGAKEGAQRAVEKIKEHISEGTSCIKELEEKLSAVQSEVFDGSLSGKDLKAAKEAHQKKADEIKTNIEDEKETLERSIERLKIDTEILAFLNKEKIEYSEFLEFTEKFPKEQTLSFSISEIPGAMFFEVEMVNGKKIEVKDPNGVGRIRDELLAF